MTTAPVKVLITGASGFVGQALAAALLSDPAVAHIVLTDVYEPPVPANASQSKAQVQSAKADLTDLQTCQSLFTKDLTLIYMLHGIMSGQAEANLELGLQVNLDSSRMIFDLLRETNPGVMVIFAGSTAVYGPPRSADHLVSENDAPSPGSSYGAQKHICETLLDDYSRRGLLDGRICRLPTVTVRPGKPTGAASSFASGIFREPLNGEKALLPVSKSTKMWICSPRTVVANLVKARTIPAASFGRSRIVNLPGVTVTVQEMLDALEAVGGEEAVRLVEEKRDEATEKIVESWPPKFNTSRASALGFEADGTLERTLKEYLEDYGPKKS